MSTKKRSSAVTASATKPSAPEPKSSKPAANLLVATIQAGLSLVAYSLSVAAIDKDLPPIFGGVATHLYFRNAVALLPIVLSFLPSLRPKNVPNALILSNCVCLAPFIYFQIAISTSRSRHIILGPVLAYTPVLVSLAYFATDLIRQFIVLLIPKASGSFGLKSIVGVITSSVAMSQQKVIGSFSYGRYINPASLLVLSGCCLASTVAIPTFSQSRLSTSKSRKTGNTAVLLMLIPPLISIFSVYPSTLPFTHRTGLLRVLSSTPSVTGRIIVGEEYKHGFRFLRADHSILGGVWIGDKAVKPNKTEEVATAKDGTKLGDSIYSAFILQEAARLHERDHPQRNALNIGLGVGIAAEAFMQHGLETTIVEIDPAVYEAATEFFGLSKPASVHFEDARTWVAKRAAQKNETYDIIVHDLFSGGGVPSHLYTVEFWNDVKRILSPEGIVAVNYAGSIVGKSARAIFATLELTFGGCRAFHDYAIDASEENLAGEFINTVFFCSPFPLPLEFRAAQPSDYLGSYLREHILRILPLREVPSSLLWGNLTTDDMEALVLRDARNPLGNWQDQNALAHWSVMRTVLPDFVWETF